MKPRDLNELKASLVKVLMVMTGKKKLNQGVSEFIFLFIVVGQDRLRTRNRSFTITSYGAILKRLVGIKLFLPLPAHLNKCAEEVRQGDKENH